jgi:phosphoribosyl 1,2-cyclic phosphodiesterase
VLDAGTGIRALGAKIPPGLKRLDLLLSHLHMDHLQGLGFFSALFNPALEVHIWGPASPTHTLRERLTRYLSPPLFPVQLRDVACSLTLHDVPADIQIGEFRVLSEMVCHPGPTVGYRIEGKEGVFTYICDHEPALGCRSFPEEAEWTSGYDLAQRADVLVHDAQYTEAEYPAKVGWGHSSMVDTLRFAELAQVKRLVLFHHDPSRDDEAMDQAVSQLLEDHPPAVQVSAGREGETFQIGAPG